MQTMPIISAIEYILLKNRHIWGQFRGFVRLLVDFHSATAE